MHYISYKKVNEIICYNSFYRAICFLTTHKLRIHQNNEWRKLGLAGNMAFDEIKSGETGGGMHSRECFILCYCFRWISCCRFSFCSLCCSWSCFRCSTKHPSASLPWRSLPLDFQFIFCLWGPGTNLSSSADSSVSNVYCLENIGK